MKRVIRLAAACLVLSVAGVAPVVAADCPNDSVRSGTVCIDKYEASMWYVPPTATTVIRKIQDGKATLADLTAAGAVQVGIVEGDFEGTGCNSYVGAGCVNVYAVSIPDVMPASWATWFQAAAAARNSLKRLPTNQEWQVAAIGTPSGAPCHVNGSGPVFTGSVPTCVSDVGAFDMVGNVAEMVADWGDQANDCVIITKPGLGGADRSCFGGAGNLDSPPSSTTRNIASNYVRGGDWDDGTEAGSLAIAVNTTAYLVGFNLRGFRGVR